MGAGEVVVVHPGSELLIAFLGVEVMAGGPFKPFFGLSGAVCVRAAGPPLRFL
jgi:hypothetical protein